MVTPSVAAHTTNGPLRYLHKYLKGYTEPAAADFAQHSATVLTRTRYSHTLIIPAYNESTAFIRQLMQQKFADCSRLLVIIVVNQPANKHSRITRLNRRIFDFFKSISQPFTCQNMGDSHQLAIHQKNAIDFLCINSCAPGVNPKQGVGYARKLGCDIALYLMQSNALQEGWLHCTDADATLPNHYFTTPSITKNISALTYTVNHQFLPKPCGFYQIQTQHANSLYEKSMLYYRDGLAQSHSPYAFTTIGSAIAANPQHYCQVRGFPKRAAGEDFYLLNKLAKLAPVIELAHTITLKPRASARVPFGTGPAIRQLLKNQRFFDYNPKVFIALKEVIDFLPLIYPQLNKALNSTDITLHSNKYLTPETQQALHSIGFAQLFTHLHKQAKTAGQALRMSHEWFDGFKTLKFIHALSQGPYPKVGLEELPYAPKSSFKDSLQTD